MSDFKVGDLVIIDYGYKTAEDPVFGIVVKIERGTSRDDTIYRVAHSNYDWVIPYAYHELEENKNEYKRSKLLQLQDSTGDNQKEDGKERSQAYNEDREWGDWGDK